jgi:zinc D-Ala-D-Ala carboxypeptidase
MAHTQQEVLEWLGDIAKHGDFSIKSVPARNASLAQAAIDIINMPVTIMPEGYLSPHFTLEELSYSDTARQYGIDNTPNAEETEQLTDLANITLEGIRTICGNKPVTITSGFRCDEVNALIGGADNSAHKYGCAADLIIPEFGTPIEVCKAIEPHLKELGIDQLIHENDSWVHIGRAIPPSTEPRCECLTISGSKTTYGIA